MCTLRISGQDLDPDALVRAVHLPVATVHRRGEPRLPASQPDGPIHENSNINIGVSDADFTDLASQVVEAQAFIGSHAEQLRLARAFPGVDSLVFDFAIEERRVPVQSDRFPSTLLMQLGALGIDLEVSRYPAAEPE